MRRRVALPALLFVLLLPGRAAAGGPSLQLGASEDAVQKPTIVQAKAELDLLKLAGLSSVRVSATWAPGQTAPGPEESTRLASVFGAAALDGFKVYVSVSQFGSRTTPLTNEDQAAFAKYAAAIAARYPALRAIIVGNEPNLNRFWLPQFNPDGTDAAAPAFESLLAKTYDAIKAVRPTLEVIGVALSPRGGDNPNGARQTHSPTTFIRDLGVAYRASGRTEPIMDAFGFHPYGDNSSQPPTFPHPTSTTIGLADYGKLVSLLGEAFDGTAQPGSTLPIFYDEYGVESLIPPAQSSLYTGTEPTTTKPVDEATQAAYYRDALALAFCQPNVQGIMIFHAIDESALDRWQSGLYYANGTPKSGVPVVRDAIAWVRRGVIAHCDGLALTPRLRYILWPRRSQLRQGRMQVSFTCDIDCSFDVRVASQHRTGRAIGGVRTTVVFSRRVAKGTYRMRMTLTAPVNPGPPLVRQSPPLTVPGQFVKVK